MATSVVDVIQKIRERQDPALYHDLHWEGTFPDYLGIVQENPLVVRNAFQRLYDMIVSFGTRRYTEYKKEITHYHFFDDPVGGGRDAIFGLDVPMMKFVQVMKAAAMGYGPERRVLLLHGPVGSSKSTIARLLKRGTEHYSRTPEGALYTFTWVDAEIDIPEVQEERGRSLRSLARAGAQVVERGESAGEFERLLQLPGRAEAMRDDAPADVGTGEAGGDPNARAPAERPRAIACSAVGRLRRPWSVMSSYRSPTRPDQPLVASR